MNESMKKGSCVKCASSTVYKRLNGIGGTDFTVDIGTWNTSASLESYVCTTCGYFENYLNRPSDLEKIASEDKWKKVVPPLDESYFPEQSYGPVILK